MPNRLATLLSCLGPRRGAAQSPPKSSSYRRDLGKAMWEPTARSHPHRTSIAGESRADGSPTRTPRGDLHPVPLPLWTRDTRFASGTACSPATRAGDRRAATLASMPGAGLTTASWERGIGLGRRADRMNGESRRPLDIGFDEAFIMPPRRSVPRYVENLRVDGWTAPRSLAGERPSVHAPDRQGQSGMLKCPQHGHDSDRQRDQPHWIHEGWRGGPVEGRRHG